MSKLFSGVSAQIPARRALFAALLGLGVLALAFAAACGESSGGSSTGAKATEKAGSSGGGSSEVTVVMKDNFFEPKTLTVNKGKVKIEYENKGTVMHNLMIQSTDLAGKDFSSAPTVQPGEKGTIEANFPKAGTIKFICAYHMPDMTGEITVK